MAKKRSVLIEESPGYACYNCSSGRGEIRVSALVGKRYVEVDRIMMDDDEFDDKLAEAVSKAEDRAAQVAPYT